MQKSQLDAAAYGVGELITQRKIFIVPEHQRNYSWGIEEVGELLSDITNALETGALDYFIGLIVLQGPIKDSWQILDGQQRLATTITIYSAIREWLRSNDFNNDAEQIEKEFIGVRRLGGKYSSRLLLNAENREIFNEYIVGILDSADIEKEIPNRPKLSSNRKLLQAALYCRRWIHDYCNRKSKDLKKQASNLFALSDYLEKRVKIICVDVSTETDAYIIFESLNHRGVDLSALDLVKNHIFSQASPGNIDKFRNLWELITENIEGKDADDFLKVFWTSRYGIIQKVDLFNKIKERYENDAGVEGLIEELADASVKLNAIDDPEHLLWHDYGAFAKDRMVQLITLGSKQVRPVILAALSNFSPNEVKGLLWYLIVLIVRYQLIGKGRTGRLEVLLGQLSQKISRKEIVDSNVALKEIDQLSEIGKFIADNDAFYRNFQNHAESNSSRLAYLLSKLEMTLQTSRGKDTPSWRSLVQNASPFPIYENFIDPDDPKKHKYVGNFVLLEDSLISEAKTKKATKSDVFRTSGFELTQTEAGFKDNDFEHISTRGEGLARLAVETWNVGNLNEIA